ncbi:MAG: hypothetical protein JSW34_04555 [Candidatus Zixiibacteriota bacterium]|nr:MAG: hypothetical protein JSW34_04555 [candidate division Zixibacteria bacterium]
MEPERVLLVCYYFPPLGGAGVSRPLALYKHLPKHGIECDVLTVKPVAYRQYEPELLDGLDTARIYRAGSHDPQRLMYLLGIRQVREAAISRGRKLSGRFFPDPKAGWVRPAVRLGRVLATNRHYGCVISTSPPVSSHLVARKLAAEFKLPWIADFRDFWTGYKAEDWFDKPRLIRRAKSLLNEITSEAAKVTVVSPAIGDYLRAGDVIFNSFDEERARRWRLPANNDYFSIGVLGTLDHLRPIEPLLKLLAHLRAERPQCYDRLRVIQVGRIDLPGFESQLAKYDLRDKVFSHGFQKRNTTIELLSESSILYLGFSAPYDRWLVTGRLFDMLASGRPILAAAGRDSLVAGLIGDTPHGCCYDAGNLSQAVQFVEQKVESFLSGEKVCQLNPDYAARFSSQNMAAKFAKIIRELA